MRFLRYTAIVFGVLVLLTGTAWFWAMHTSSGARFMLDRAEPFGLTVAAIDGSIGSGVELAGIRFANDAVDVSVAELTASFDIGLFPLDITVTTARASDVSIVVAEPDDQAAAARPPGEALESLVLPLPITISDLRATDIAVDAAGQQRRIDVVELAATWFEKIEIGRLYVSAYDVAVTGAADLDPASGVLTADASVDDVLDIDAEASLTDEISAVASIAITGLELAGYVDNWPAGFPIDGSVEAAVDSARLQLSDSILRIRGTDAQINLGARLDRVTEELQANVGWVNLRWPLRAEVTRIRSDVGDLVLSGNVDDWTVAGNIEIEADDIPAGAFQIEGEGARHSLAGRIVDSDVFGGRVAGEVSFEWLDPRAWSANLEVSNINLDWLDSEWPAVISGRIDSHGTGDPFTLHAVLDDIDGKLRGLPLQVDGTIDLDTKSFVADYLRIVHGTSRATLDGSMHDAQGLQFDAEVDDLATYMEGVTGSLAATGTVSLADGEEGVDLALQSPSLMIGETEVSDVVVGVTATPGLQLLRFDAVQLGTEFGIALEGVFEDWLRPWDSAFVGTIDDFNIALEDEHSMVLVDDAPLEFQRDGMTLTDFCIGDETGSSLCSDVRWSRSSGEFALDLELADVPIALVEHVATSQLEFDQRVSGSVDWLRTADGRSSGNGKLQVSAGRVLRVANETVSVETGPGNIDFRIEDGRLLSGDLRLPLPGSGNVAGQFEVLDVRRFRDSTIVGGIDADIEDIAALTLLTSAFDSASGHLRIRLDMGGTLQDPRLNGQATLSGGSFHYLPLGLRLDEVDLTAALDENYRAEVTGTFKAGDGRGQLVSHADYGNAEFPGLLFKLQGSNLTLVDVPDVHIEINPDIDITLDGDTLSIDGSLVVPRARVKPTNLTVARVNESEDVIIVAGELPDPPEEPKRQTDLSYEGKLNIELGDDVAVDLDLASASISGAVAFEWLGDVMPTANGRYSIDGSVEAFGQVLDIREGIINFPRVPADQPNIRVAAEREIYGNTQVKRAGILIDGPVSRPTVEAYTMPMTTEERALALLVTGSDFDYEQGVGAIDFGTYIAPRLFVSYGVGVFERENIISARFDLARGFGIKASSGSKESGIDLNYRFEN